MRLGMIGLGRMGGNMTQRLLRGGHDCVVFDADDARVMAAAGGGATASSSLEALVALLDAPRIVWLMLPAGAVDATVLNLAPLLQAGDVIIDGGNSHYVDDIRRAKSLAASRHSLRRCRRQRRRLGSRTRVLPDDRRRGGRVYASRAHFPDARSGRRGGLHDTGPNRIPGRRMRGTCTAVRTGAGHFVKMVHNGIEYALMAAYAEGLNILAHANVGARGRR